MSRYKASFDKNAQKQLKLMNKSGRKTDVERVARFTEEIKAHPRTGTGKPKQMGHKEVETWSRRVNDGDRFVYEIYEDEREILVTQVLGHYEDR